MNTIILPIVFIVSDLLLLFNSMAFQNEGEYRLNKIRSAKNIVLILLYSAFSFIFFKYFKLPNKGLMSVLFAVYYLRLFAVSILITERITFSSFYAPIFLCSLDSLFQSCILCGLRLFADNVNSQFINKLSSLIFQSCVAFILNLAVKKQWINNLKFALNKLSKFISILILSCIFILDGIISLIEYDTDKLSLPNMFIEIFLIILMFMVFVIMILLLINNMSKQYFEDTSHLLEKQIQTQLAHYNSLKELKKEYHSFRHDYINHMHCLTSLINTDKKSEALEYINKLSKSKIIFEKPYETGNDILDSILAEKAELAKQYGINIKVDGLFTTEFNPVDLCIIFSNALDNAVEACQNLDGEKVISVVLNIRQNHQFISVSNPFDGGLNVNKGEINSAKKDTERHGFGLKNIQAAAERHCGTIETVCENNVFYLNVVLKM